MGNVNGACNAQIGVLPMATRKRTWAPVLIALAAFVLAMALAVVASPSAAFADETTGDATNTDTTNADAGGNTTGGEGGSVADGDISLTPTDSNELKSDEPEPAEIISVTIISRDGQALQTFQIEKGKTISFVDEQGEVLVQYTVEDSSVVEPVAPVKGGYDFVGWSVKINDEGNAVVSPLYKESVTPTPSPSSDTTDDVKTSRSASGTLTTNSPKTGDLLPLVVSVAVAGAALIAMLVLLFARRRS